MAEPVKWPEQEIIRLVRRSYGYTIRDLARLAGVHEVTVRNWENEGLSGGDEDGDHVTGRAGLPARAGGRYRSGRFVRPPARRLRGRGRRTRPLRGTLARPDDTYIDMRVRARIYDGSLSG